MPRNKWYRATYSGWIEFMAPNLKEARKIANEELENGNASSELTIDIEPSN